MACKAQIASSKKEYFYKKIYIPMPRILYKALFIKLYLLFLFFFTSQNNISQNLESHTVAPEGFIGIGIGVNDYGIGVGM
jgi:hypothetical protein